MSPRRAAIYARISQDRDGSGQGVKRQLKDCHEEATRRGWSVAGEYVDDDVSAYSGSRRPQYAQLLEDIAAGTVDAVLVWHMDRLHRRPIELEQFVTTCLSAGLHDVVTLHGDFDIGNGDGLLVARLMSAVAANESDAKSRRGRRKMQEIAEAGLPHGGGTRPCGFNDDRVTHRPDEARAIRALADRALAGESLTSLCRWLTDEGITTVTGKEWRTPTVRGLLLNPRIYGMRSHRGEPICRAVWKQIISPEQGEALRVMLTDPARRTNRTARSYLLSGMCRCALCGTVMFSMSRYDTRRYLCRSGHDFGGCGRMAINALPLEQMVEEMVLVRLDGPDLQAALAGKAKDTTTATELAEQIADDTTQLAELAQLYADRRIRAEEWITARDPVEQRRNEARRELSQLGGAQVIDRYIGHGLALRRQWSTLNLDRQRAIVKAIISHVEIRPATPGARSVEIQRINPVWRL
jgi:site-specific DNA recombinase